MKNKLLLMVIVVVGSIHHVSCSTNNDWGKDLQRGRDEGMLIVVKPEGTDYEYVAINPEMAGTISYKSPALKAGQIASATLLGMGLANYNKEGFIAVGLTGLLISVLLDVRDCNLEYSKKLNAIAVVNHHYVLLQSNQKHPSFEQTKKESDEQTKKESDEQTKKESDQR